MLVSPRARWLGCCIVWSVFLSACGQNITESEKQGKGEIIRTELLFCYFEVGIYTLDT